MKRTVLAIAGLAIAALAVGQLAKYKDWAKSPESYFLTAEERAEWSKITTDADAEKFIAGYWAKHGGERFKEAINRRIAAADEQFKMLRQRGAESARGRIYIVLGSPNRRTVSRPGGAGGEGTPDTGQGRENFGDTPFGSATGQTTENWIYNKDKFDPSWGIGELRATIIVDPQRGADALQNSDEVNRVLAKIAEKSIVSSTATQPGPTAAAPVPAQPASPPSASAPAVNPPNAPPASPAGALPAATRTSLEAILKEKMEASNFWGGAFHAATGAPFYAIQFYFDGDKAPASGTKFGGIVTNESGSEAASFWEDANLTDAKTGSRADRVYERSLVLPPGNYKAALGIFPAEGAALESASVTFRLESKPAEFDVSPLILANDLRPLTKRPEPTDPFIFGVEKPIKVPPKADGTFSKQDSLWYFYEVSNPTIAEVPAAAQPAPPPSGTPAPASTPAPAAQPKPRVMQRIGVLRDGKPAFAPFTGPAEMQILSPGSYGSGSEIPLATFEPGYYTFTLNVRDLNAPRDSVAFKGIDRQANFIVLKPDGTLPEKAASKPAGSPTPKPRPKKSG